VPVLENPRHELFAQELSKGKTATEAYVLAGYEDNRGNAATLKANQNVQDRVAELQEDGAALAKVTVASIIDELEDARSVAKTAIQPASMVSASMGKAKVAGLLADRVEHTGKDGGPIQTEDITDGEAARRIAFALNKGVQAEKPTEH
jgi:phage terminase small subunit